jgi:hypothetical protein
LLRSDGSIHDNARQQQRRPGIPNDPKQSLTSFLYLEGVRQLNPASPAAGTRMKSPPGTVSALQRMAIDERLLHLM